MSDVTAIQNLVQKRIELKKEISKIIVGQDVVIDQILLSIFSGGKNVNGKYYCASFRIRF
jgi:MoxR-like ATPase